MAGPLQLREGFAVSGGSPFPSRPGYLRHSGRIICATSFFQAPSLLVNYWPVLSNGRSNSFVELLAQSPNQFWGELAASWAVQPERR